MRIKLIADDGTVLRLATDGEVTQASLLETPEPISAMFGPDIYERRVLLNLEHSAFVDSVGVGWLLKCHKRFQVAGGRIVLHSIPPLVQQMLKLLRLDQVLHVADSTPQAMQLAQAEAG